VKLFKITGRHTQVKTPDGVVLTCWLGAKTKEDALTLCAEKGIIDIECIIDDTNTNPFLEGKKGR
tara:strand:+ start:562 stop:756 length:195 start_codon:yes stop_codon:yes gene_type:complete